MTLLQPLAVVLYLVLVKLFAKLLLLQHRESLHKTRHVLHMSLIFERLKKLSDDRHVNRLLKARTILHLACAYAPSTTLVSAVSQSIYPWDEPLHLTTALVACNVRESLDRSHQDYQARASRLADKLQHEHPLSSAD